MQILCCPATVNEAWNTICHWETGKVYSSSAHKPGDLLARSLSHEAAVLRVSRWMTVIMYTCKRMGSLCPYVMLFVYLPFSFVETAVFCCERRIGMSVRRVATIDDVVFENTDPVITLPKDSVYTVETVLKKGIVLLSEDGERIMIDLVTFENCFMAVA